MKLDSPSRLLLTLLVGCALGGAAVWLAGGARKSGTAAVLDGREAPGRPEPARSSRPLEVALEPADPDPPVERTVAESSDLEDPRSDRPKVPVRQTLAGFRGPHWPEIEAHLASRPNPKLDQEWSPPAPWEEVEAVLERLLAEAIERQRRMIPVRIHSKVGLPLPNPLTAEALVGAPQRWRLGVHSVSAIDAQTLARVQAAAAPLLARLERERRDLVDAYHEACLRVVHTQRVGRMPYFLDNTMSEVMGRGPGNGYIGGVVISHRGWAIDVDPLRDEHPELELMAEQRILPLNEELASVLRASLRR